MDNLNAVKLSSEELDRELEVLRNLAARTQKFVGVDSLPLFPEALTSRRPASSSFPDRSFRLRDQNQYFTDPRAGPGEVLQPLFHPLSHDPEPSLGGLHFPIQAETITGGGDFSVRRASAVHNVTTRETKRPKEREKDKEYRRRTLTGADTPLCTFHTHTVTGREGLQPPPLAERQIAQQGAGQLMLIHPLSLSHLPTEIGTEGRLYFHLEDGSRQELHRQWRALTRVACSKLPWSMREGRFDTRFTQRCLLGS